VQWRPFFELILVPSSTLPPSIILGVLFWDFWFFPRTILPSRFLAHYSSSLVSPAGPLPTAVQMLAFYTPRVFFPSRARTPVYSPLVWALSYYREQLLDKLSFSKTIKNGTDVQFRGVPPADQSPPCSQLIPSLALAGNPPPFRQDRILNHKLFLRCPAPNTPVQSSSPQLTPEPTPAAPLPPQISGGPYKEGFHDDPPRRDTHLDWLGRAFDLRPASSQETFTPPSSPPPPCSTGSPASAPPLSPISEHYRPGPSFFFLLFCPPPPFLFFSPASSFPPPNHVSLFFSPWAGLGCSGRLRVFQFSACYPGFGLLTP